MAYGLLCANQVVPFTQRVMLCGLTLPFDGRVFIELHEELRSEGPVGLRSKDLLVPDESPGEFVCIPSESLRLLTIGGGNGRLVMSRVRGRQVERLAASYAPDCYLQRQEDEWCQNSGGLPSHDRLIASQLKRMILVLYLGLLKKLFEAFPECRVEKFLHGLLAER